MSTHSDLHKLSTPPNYSTRLWVQKYLGTNKPTRCIKSALIKQLAKKELISIHTVSDFYKRIDDIYSQATTFEEMALAAAMFTKGEHLRDSSDITWLEKWLDNTVGWAEVDSLCQSSIGSEKILQKWSMWSKQLTKFSQDKNIHKRRASMVLLCRSLRESSDTRISDLAFKLVESMKGEKEILITKAISWVLRCVVKHHPDELAVYLEDNKTTLPRIAYREASKKLATGRKS